MTGLSSEPVNPDVYNLLDKHLDMVETGTFDATTALKRESPIVVFCETFFQQFFDKELSHEIFAIDDETKTASAEIRIGLEEGKSDSSHPTEKLLLAFEELCDYWPDVLGFGYGGSSGEFRRFHRTYLPKLLKRILTWAKQCNYEQLTVRAKSGMERYGELKGRL